MNHIMAWVGDCSLQVGSIEEVEHHTPKAQDENYKDSSFHLIRQQGIQWKSVGDSYTLGMLSSDRCVIIFTITKKPRKETKMVAIDNLTASMSGGAIFSAPWGRLLMASA